MYELALYPKFQLVAAKLLAAAGHHAGLEEVVARLQQLHPALNTVLAASADWGWVGSFSLGLSHCYSKQPS